MNKPIIINISSSNHTPEKIDQSHIKDTSFKSGTIQGELHLCTWFWLLAQQLSYWSRSAEDYNTDGASWHQRVWDLIWHKGLTYTKLLLTMFFFSGGHNCTGKRWVFYDILAKYFDLSLKSHKEDINTSGCF